MTDETLPDFAGHFGRYGGRFVPEALVKALDELDAALTSAGVTHKFNVYPGTNHAFNNDTGNAYNQEQALAAWRDVLAWFKQYLA